jgi:hypothetical protein
MYKKHIIWLIIIFLGLFKLSNFLYPFIVHQNLLEFISNSITFLSIILGFSITSLSILFSSNYVRNLYNEDDFEDKSLTLLHRLANYYKASFYISFFTLMYLLIIGIIPSIKYLEIIIFPLLGINIYIQYLLISLFLRLFVKNVVNE